MKTKLIGAYVGVVLCGFVILAAALLLILQWDKTSYFSWFAVDTEPYTVVLVLAAAAFGVMLPWLVKLLLHCVMIIRRHRRQSATISKAVNKAVSSKQEPPRPADEN